MDYKITVRVPDNGNTAAKTLGTFGKPYTVSGKDIDEFRKYQLDGQALQTSVLQQAEKQVQNTEKIRLMVVISKLKMEIAECAEENKGLENRLRQEQNNVNTLDNQISDKELEIRRLIENIKKSHANTIEQKNLVEVLLETALPDLKISVSEAIWLFEQVGNLKEAFLTAYGSSIDEALHKAGVPQATEMLETCETLLQSNLSPETILSTPTMPEFSLAAWLEKIPADSHAIAASANAPLELIQRTLEAQIAFDSGEFKHFRALITSKIERGNSAAKKLKTDMKHKRDLLNGVHNPNISGDYSLPPGMRKEDVIYSIEENCKIFVECRDCLKKTYQLYIDLMHARTNYLKSIHAYAKSLERLPKAEEEKAELMLRRKNIPNSDGLVSLLTEKTGRQDQLEAVLADAEDWLLKIEIAEWETRKKLETRKNRKKEADRLYLEKLERETAPVASTMVFERKQPKIDSEPVAAEGKELVEVLLSRFVQSQLEYFKPSLKNCTPAVIGEFTRTFERLAMLYLKNGGKLHLKILQAAAQNRTKPENPAGYYGYNIVRFGVTEGNAYRIMIDVKHPEKPIILFAGHKYESDPWLDPKNGKFVNDYSKALRNGQADAFEPLAKAVLQVNGTAKE